MRREPDQELNGLAERVIGAAIEVHRHLGAGFLEVTYQRALMIELRLRDIPFQEQVPVSLCYKEESVGDGIMDLLIDGRLIVELKATEPKSDGFRRQAVTYLRAAGLQLGLVINFNTTVLKDGIARVVHSPE